MASTVSTKMNAWKHHVMPMPFVKILPAATNALAKMDTLVNNFFWPKIGENNRNLENLNIKTPKFSTLKFSDFARINTTYI